MSLSKSRLDISPGSATKKNPEDTEGGYRAFSLLSYPQRNASFAHRSLRRRRVKRAILFP
jgi:hypothetical protein